MNNVIENLNRNKNNNKFLPIVNKAALSDALHDFKSFHGLLSDNNNIQNEALPVPESNQQVVGSDEDTLLNSIIEDNKFRDMIYKYLPDNTMKVQPESTKQVTIQFDGQLFNTYNACSFNINCSTTPDELPVLTDNENFGKNFVERTQLGSSGCRFMFIYPPH